MIWGQSRASTREIHKYLAIIYQFEGKLLSVKFVVSEKNDMKKFMSCWENSIELNHWFSGKPLLLTKVNSSQIENFLWMVED